jgi:hypothetical protein
MRKLLVIAGLIALSMPTAAQDTQTRVTPDDPQIRQTCPEGAGKSPFETQSRHAPTSCTERLATLPGRTLVAALKVSRYGLDYTRWANGGIQ